MKEIIKVSESEVKDEDIKKGDSIIFILLEDRSGHEVGAKMFIVKDFHYEKNNSCPMYEERASVFVPFVKNRGDAIDFITVWMELGGKEIVIENDLSAAGPGKDVVLHIK